MARVSIARWNLKEAGWQTAGLTNRNRMRRMRVGKAAKQAEAQKLHRIRSVDAAGRWRERSVSYLGRSHGRVGSKSPYGAKLAVRSQQRA